MPGRIRNAMFQASSLMQQARQLMNQLDAKELEELIDGVLDLMGWAEDTVDVLKKENAIKKAMVLLDAGVRIVELVEPLVKLIEGDEDSSDVPSWIAVLIPLIKKLRATTGKQND